MNIEDHFLVNTTKAALYLGVSPSFLAKARLKGDPAIPYVKLGAVVRYRLQDLEEFAGENLQLNTNQNKH